jgi:hypothetical protein
MSDQDRDTLGGWTERLRQLPHLYRYVSVRGERFKWLFDVVARSSIYFPSFAELNDPFDGAIRPSADATPVEKRAYWERYLKEGGPAVDAVREHLERLSREPDDGAVQLAVDQELAGVGILALTEVPDDLPMWAYYADAHSGVCLRFNTQRLFNPEREGCSPPMPVTYEDIYPSLSFYRDTRFRRGQVSLATKASVWGHEIEWRMIRRAGSGSATLNEGALDGIILGCRVRAEDEARIRQLVHGHPLELLRARVQTGRFGLDIVPA